MKINNGIRSLLLALMTLYLSGCNDSTDPPKEYIMSVPSSPVYYGSGLAFTPVIGVPGQLQNGNTIFVHGIFDFDYKFGTSYELRLVEFDVTSEGASLRVAEIISAVSDPIGTRYVYSDVELTRTSFTDESDEVYAFHRYEFLCAEGVDCDSLVAIADSGGLVEVEFEYTGGDVPITLVRWN